MKTGTFLTSSCRYCRYFHHEGRRGGTCQQLNVEVQAGWTACSLATHPFPTSWEKMEELVLLENALSLPTIEHQELDPQTANIQRSSR